MCLWELNPLHTFPQITIPFQLQNNYIYDYITDAIHLTSYL
jgi:hypothetical protein